MSDADEALTDLLLKIAAEREISNPQVKIHPTSSGGGNYTSELFVATIANEDTELKLFAKVAAVGKIYRENFPMQLFEVENAFYTRLAKIYKKLQDKHNVSEDNSFILPELYGCSDKLYEEIVVLENLSAKDFKVYDRLKSVDWEYASKAVEEIAKFHALSFAFKKEEPKEFNKFVKEFGYNWKSKSDYMWNNGITTACNTVKKENKEKLRKFLENIDAGGFTDLSKPLRGTVLGHNEYRVSNQMYKRDADGRVQLRIIDFQSVRATAPVVDLLYFIFISSDEKFREQYYEKLLDHYYTELSLAMKRLGLDPHEVYSRDDFDFEYKAKLPFGLSVAVFMLPMVTLDQQNAPKVHLNIEMSSFIVDKPSDVYSKLLNGIVNDFIRWGIM